MTIAFFDIAGPFLVTPRSFEDDRGVFMETYRAKDLADAAGQTLVFVQENLSRSTRANTVRGLHFQYPPAAQGKLIRCVKGRVLDVAVDLRRESGSYGQHIAVSLDARLAQSFWVPPGFAHGFLTQQANCEVSYKVTANYAPALDSGLYWNDPDLGIDWGITAAEAVLSDKDKHAGRFADFDTPF